MVPAPLPPQLATFNGSGAHRTVCRSQSSTVFGVPASTSSRCGGGAVLLPPPASPASALHPGRVSRSAFSGVGGSRGALCPAVCATPPSLAQKPRLSYVGPIAGLGGGSSSSSGDGMSPDKTHWGERVEEAAAAFGGILQPPPISRPNDYFVDKLGVEFVETREGILLTELNDLFEKVGFPRRDPDKLRIALEHTYHLVWVRAARQSRLARAGQMIGFARATSDGVLSATVWDVAVNPAWQRSGLGRALMERLTTKLVEDGIPTITLYAEPGVVGLYEKLGYVKDPEGIRGMAFQRKKTAGGSSKGGLQGQGAGARLLTRA